VIDSVHSILRSIHDLAPYGAISTIVAGINSVHCPVHINRLVPSDDLRTDLRRTSYVLSGYPRLVVDISSTIHTAVLSLSLSLGCRPIIASHRRHPLILRRVYFIDYILRPVRLRLVLNASYPWCAGRW